MTDTGEAISRTTATKAKFSAKQIETDCPNRLQQIGREIAARIKKADKQFEQAENHSISISKLIAEARDFCDGGGFDAFQKKFFPDLGKSRIYELLAIGTNKKSVGEIRANTRARVAKSRARKAAAVSATVTEKPEHEAPAAPEVEVQPTSTVTEHKPEPKPWRGRASDEGMRRFTVHTLELHNVTENRPAEHYSTTKISPKILAQLGSLFTDLAKLRSEAGIAVRGSDSEVSAEQSAEAARTDVNLDGRGTARLAALTDE